MSVFVNIVHSLIEVCLGVFKKLGLFFESCAE
jgi:hypothetical protein